MLLGLSLAFKKQTAGDGSSTERAVDGNMDMDWSGMSCTETDGQDPWWRVDLGRDYYVSSVKIYNRVDCCGDRLRNFEIRVGK